jgi:hypothetical protein
MTPTDQAAGDHAELLVIDGIGYLMPAIRPDMSSRLRWLLGLRREATITGRCPRCEVSATGGAPLGRHAWAS